MSTASDGRLRFEEIAVGMAWDTPGITVTEGHILAFAGLSGDFYDIHVDDDYARSLGYPGRIAHGLLGLALADGLKNRATTRVAAIVALGWRWRFTGAILVGDRIHAGIRVVSKRETRHADRGIVTFDLTLLNQRGEVVQAGETDQMVHRLPA
ncbi:MaoC family dehydratase [Falsiroseomonas sp. HW251]|uniref:MaoC family dehydratase n=1 Tax=Falsiroseomonas sp. HW251 TaxID=3390998 RepID=UPI003D31988D